MFRSQSVKRSKKFNKLSRKNIISGICTGLAVASFSMIATPSSAQATAEQCAALEAKAAGGYKGVFYANDFKYLNVECDASLDKRDAFTRFGDSMKQMSISDGSSSFLDIGGEFRSRYHDESNHGLTKLAGLDNSFNLTRLRLYANLEVNEHIRLYVEGIDGRYSGGELPFRGIEVDHNELLNAFADFKFNAGENKINIRVGRQELLFGGQRFVSPLNWSNTRRAFDGIRIDHKNGDWNSSVFATRTLDRKATDFNNTNDSQSFIGLYSTYSGVPNNTIDLYYLRFKETVGTKFTLPMIGARIKGSSGNWLYEAEGAYQFGERGGKDHRAYMFTGGVGYSLPSTPWKPVVWLYYDTASGDDNKADNTDKTFHQLFPLGHAYFGFLDLVGRQNISALSLRVTAKPHARLTLHGALHTFNLANDKDSFYNAGSGAIRTDLTGTSGSHLGEEFDATATINVTKRVNLQLGYAHFFPGGFVEKTNPAGVTGKADFFYTQLILKF